MTLNVFGNKKLVEVLKLLTRANRQRSCSSGEVENLTIQYAQKQSILGSKNGLKLTKIVHIAQMSTDRFRILFKEE